MLVLLCQLFTDSESNLLCFCCFANYSLIIKVIYYACVVVALCDVCTDCQSDLSCFPYSLFIIR